MDPPPTPHPGPEAPPHVPPVSAAEAQSAHHMVRQAFPDIAKYAELGRYDAVIASCNDLEITLPNEVDIRRFLVNVPLVLASLLLDNVPAAVYALRRLPEPLAASTLPQALFSLTASISERKYQNIQSRLAALLELIKKGSAVEPELAVCMQSMVSALQVAWRKRTMELLAKAYAAVPVAFASTLLQVSNEQLVGELPSWTFNAGTGTITPPTQIASKLVGVPVNIPILDGMIGSAAQLESSY